MIEKLFTTEQVAEYLQVHPLTVLKYIKAEQLKAIRLGKRAYRIRESDLQRFLSESST